MQLFLNATSPFARFARVVAIEKGLADQLQLRWCDPWSNDPALLEAHPQGRIPVLRTEDGSAISESLLIALYFDALAPTPSLVPIQSRAAALAQTSVAYGLMEAAFQMVIAHKHEGALAHESVMGQRRASALQRALQWVEHQDIPVSGAAWQLGHLCLAIALEYVQFRLPHLLPTPAHTHCQRWLAAASQRTSLRTTAFV